MYFLLTLFFISLVGIIVMIGRKVVKLQNGQVVLHQENFSQAPVIEELKEFTIKSLKKHSYAGLVGTIRIYVKTSNILKIWYQGLKVKVVKMLTKNKEGEEEREVSGFLKMMSDYKKKIRRIKRKIKEEEEINS